MKSKPKPKAKSRHADRPGRSQNSSYSERDRSDRDRKPSFSRPSRPAPDAPTKPEKVVEEFSVLWENLFSSPVHLDSALSKLAPKMKGILAQIVPVILLRPTSLAEALGVGVTEGEPWSLASPRSEKAEPSLIKKDASRLRRWRPAEMIAERLYEGMSQRWPDVHPMETDFPSWMVDEWRSSWGNKVTQNLIRVLGLEAPLSLRASQKVGAQALFKTLSQAGLPTRVALSDLVPYGVRLGGYAPVLNTELYKSGGFEIQDEGSQLMALFALSPSEYAHLLSDQPGPRAGAEDVFAKQTAKSSAKKAVNSAASSISKVIPKMIPRMIIDACAGAGGKSLAMADAIGGKARIFAYDTSEKKLQALRRRATRMGLNNIQAVAVEEGKESELVDRFKGKADIVLVDAPCSGWGVLRRNPDIKWRQNRDVLTRMPEIQLRLLSEYSKLVISGGRLVFGVCTFRKDETTEVVKRFLSAHPDFVAQEGGFLGPGPCDGFFMQSFLRK